MFLFQDKNDDFRLAVWQLTETVDELSAMVEWGSELRQEAENRFKSLARQREWVAVRVMLTLLLGQRPRIAYLPSGRPYFIDSDLQLSISHTGRYVAVILSPTIKVAVDIEMISEKVTRVRRRFVREDEEAESTLALLLHWCAKEAAYKLLDHSGVDFLCHLKVEGVDGAKVVADYEGTSSGIGAFSLTESITSERKSYKVVYRIGPDYVLTWIVEH